MIRGLKWVSKQLQADMGAGVRVGPLGATHTMRKTACSFGWRLSQMVCFELRASTHCILQREQLTLIHPSSGQMLPDLLKMSTLPQFQSLGLWLVYWESKYTQPLFWIQNNLLTIILLSLVYLWTSAPLHSFILCLFNSLKLLSSAAISLVGKVRLSYNSSF